MGRLRRQNGDSPQEGEKHINTNIKEIGHVSFRLKSTVPFRNFYEKTLGLRVGFSLMTGSGEERIIYYQLHHGHFIEIFPETSVLKWTEYDGHNREEDYSYQCTTLGGGEGKLIRDPEYNTWKINEGPLYISRVTYDCRNLQRAKSFYGDILGMDFLLDTPECVLAKVNEEQVIELRNRPYPKDNCTNNKGQRHIALIVHDIELAAERLRGKGIQLYYGPKMKNRPYLTSYQKVAHTEHSYNFYIQDYDDNEIEVMAYSDQSFQVKYALE